MELGVVSVFFKLVSHVSSVRPGINTMVSESDVKATMLSF